MNSELTVSEQKALSKAAPRLMKAWNLTDQESIRLMGLTSVEWHHLTTHQSGCFLKEEQIQRIGALIGVYAALMVIYSGDASRVARWVSAENSGAIMDGRKPLEAMLEGGLPTMNRIRLFLQAEVVGCGQH